MSKTLQRRAHVVLPVDLVADIDKLVGKRGRSAFLTGVARDEIQRLHQQNALRAAKSLWKDEDHPELREGSIAWVRKLRDESEGRLREIEDHRNHS